MNFQNNQNINIQSDNDFDLEVDEEKKHEDVPQGDAGQRAREGDIRDAIAAARALRDAERKAGAEQAEVDATAKE
ncbi:MAG: hypothetical protein Q8P90_05465 [bacterium]|nr:hypothetical protein [bacterium]